MKGGGQEGREKRAGSEGDKRLVQVKRSRGGRGEFGIKNI